MEINGDVISGSAHVSHLFVFRLDSFSYVPASFYALLHKFNIFFTVS
ncbi:hypothetical protein M3642_03465 [Priestia megaterium]|nr:hypothetical protein [Priestia megaterium]